MALLATVLRVYCSLCSLGAAMLSHRIFRILVNIQRGLSYPSQLLFQRLKHIFVVSENVRVFVFLVFSAKNRKYHSILFFPRGPKKNGVHFFGFLHIAMIYFGITKRFFLYNDISSSFRFLLFLSFSKILSNRIRFRPKILSDITS